jgi:hypothetical protein
LCRSAEIEVTPGTAKSKPAIGAPSFLANGAI